VSPPVRAKRLAKKPYHHGDLRRALLDSALLMLGEPGGIGLLTLREVARRAGVSHAAPYRHFPSKEALLAEVAEEGFRRLNEEMLRRAETAGEDGLRRLSELGVGYVAFAAQFPAHFQVMFSTTLSSPHPALEEAGKAAFGTLLDSIIQCQKAGLMRARDPMALAVTNWGLVHGLAQLIIHGQLGFTGISAETERMTRMSVRTLLEGAAMPGPGG